MPVSTFLRIAAATATAGLYLTATAGAGYNIFENCRRHRRRRFKRVLQIVAATATAGSYRAATADAGHNIFENCRRHRRRRLLPPPPLPVPVCKNPKIATAGEGRRRGRFGVWYIHTSISKEFTILL